MPPHLWTIEMDYVFFILVRMCRLQVSTNDFMRLYTLLSIVHSYGEAANALFRIGHMGSQTDRETLDYALNALKEVINEL